MADFLAMPIDTINSLYMVMYSREHKCLCRPWDTHKHSKIRKNRKQFLQMCKAQSVIRTNRVKQGVTFQHS